MNQEIEQDDAVKRLTPEDELRKKVPVAKQPIEEDFENPISALTALKHPEIMARAT